MFLFDLFNKNNAIFSAVRNNDSTKLYECIRQGISVNYAKNNGQTPLMYAADLGHLEMVQLLLKLGADVNRVDKNNVNALTYASSRGFQAIVDCLAPKTSNLNMALREAIIHEHVAIVRYLVDKVSNLNVLSKHQTTFLAEAAERNLDIVKILVEAGADIDARSYMFDFEEATPLMHAVSYDQFEIVQYLVEQGADVNAKYKYGNVLDITDLIESEKGPQIEAYLKSKGATY